AVEEFDFEGGDLEPGAIRSLDIEIANTGRKILEHFTARLWSEAGVARVIEDEVGYEAIEPGETGNAQNGVFRVRAHPLTIPGMKIVFVLTVETENGFRDTTSITYQVGNPGQGDPFGPDDYGYVCFDSGDEDWEIRPEYEWIEIDPDEDDNDFNGENLGLRDSGEDQDESEVVDLPFDFQYYGDLFDRITICTNGWAAFGSYPRLSDFRNRRIASGGGPNAQLCVFWDNLRTGRILTYHDEDGGRFIVEWNNMSRLWGGQRETFELILYSQEAQPTYTGDGVIIFQYKDIQNASGNDAAGNDTPYATVGIGNLDDTDGLEYTYWNRYHDGATQLRDEMAIKFTTATHFITGVLNGTVTDAATGEPVADAEIIASRGPRLGGFWSESDTLGQYLNDEVLIGEHYSITASAQGYNDSTLTGFEILEGETLTVDFALLHPEFNLSGEELEFTMLPDSVTEAGLTLRNSGNGTLRFTSRYVYVFDNEEAGFGPAGQMEGPTVGPTRRTGRDDPDDTWDELLTWNAGDTLDDSRINGIVYDHHNNHWIISGDAGGADENWLYIFDRRGSYVDRIAQPIAGRYGIRDMDYYNGQLYCATSGSYIMLVDPESGEEINRWTSPQRLRSIRNVAVVNDTLLFASDISNDLFLVRIADDSTLAEVRRYPLRDPRDENLRIRMYGLSYFRDDPDGFNLYIMSNNDPFSDPEAPNISIFKLNTINGEIRLLTTLSNMDPNTSGRGGITITPKWNNLVWVLAAVFDNPDGDFVDIFELAPNSSWLDYTPRSDTLLATESVPIQFEIASADLDTGRYGVVIEFNHNAGDGITRRSVTLHVVDELPPPPYADEDEMLPFEYSLDQNRPNPFNPSTVISYSLREPGLTQLTIFDLLGREVNSLVNTRQAPGRYDVTFDSGGLPAGIYFYRLNSGSFSAVRKMVVVK
ncbi:MAG TPA: T9SS type A sorting domain-containing protein, partial [Bacteroidetes bacterium]|nr:T9SS type A sorting domain-containing protein [Bacteroidota bacterium]